MTRQHSTNSADIIHNGDCGTRFDDWCHNHHNPSYYSKHSYNNTNNIINKVKCGEKMESRHHHHHHHHYLSEKGDTDYCLDPKTDDFCLPSPPDLSSLDDYSSYNETRLSQLSIDGGYHGGEGSRSSDSLPAAEYEDIALGHSHQPSYAQSEGYHSYVSSSDSTTTSNTPFIDRLRRESEYLVSSESGARDSSPSSGSSSETLKWRGSLTDVCPAIARSARVPAPQRHHSESVLYLEPDRRLFPVSTYEPATVSANRGCAKLSVAERVSELERQTRDHSELKAIQKKALLSFYERHHSTWKSEPQLSPPPRPPPPAPPSSRRSSSASEHAPNSIESSRSSYDGGLPNKMSGSNSVKESRHQYSSSCGSLATGLVGPMIVGPAISVDDWVPARPPKKAHLRARSPEPPPPPPPAGPYSEEPLPPPPPPEMLAVEEPPPHAKFNERFVDNVTESWPPGPPLPTKGRPRPPPTLHLVGGREPRSLDSCVNRPGPQTAPARITNGESKISYRDVRETIMRAQHQHTTQPPLPSRGSNERLSVRYRPSVTAAAVAKVVRSPSDRKHYNRQLSLQQLPTAEPASYARQSSLSTDLPLSRAVSQQLLLSNKEQLVARALSQLNGEQQQAFAKPVTLQTSPGSEVKQFARQPLSDTFIKSLSASPSSDNPVTKHDQLSVCKEIAARKTSLDSSLDASRLRGDGKIMVEEIKPVVEAVRVGEAPTSEPVPTRMPLVAQPLSKRFALSRPSDSLMSRHHDTSRHNGSFQQNHRSDSSRQESQSRHFENHSRLNGSPKFEAQNMFNEIIRNQSSGDDCAKDDAKRSPNSELKSSSPRNVALFTPIKEDDRPQSGLQCAKPAQVTPPRTTPKPEPTLSPHPPPTTHQLSQSKGSSYVGSYRGGSRDAVPSKDRAMLTGVVHGTYKRTMSPSPPTIHTQPHRDKDKEDVDAVLEERSGKEGRDLVRSLARNFSSVSASAAVGVAAAPAPKRRPPRAASDPTSAALHPSTLEDDDRPSPESRVNGTPEEPNPPEPSKSTPPSPNMAQSSPTPDTPTEEASTPSEPSPPPQAEPPPLPPAVDASVQTTPAPSPPPTQEEIDCDLLSRHLADQLSPSQHRLHQLLAPGPEVKRCTDYVSGLFRLDIQRRISPVLPTEPNSITSNGSKESGSDADGIESSSGVASAASSDLSSASSIVSVSSATSSTSVGSNTPITNGHISPTPTAPPQSMGTLQQKKEELVGRLTRKVAVLRAEAAALAEETRSNDALGESLSSVVGMHATPPEASRYAVHVQETGHITSLLLALSARLARVDNSVLALPPSASENERKALDSKREKLVTQLGEAKKLKAAIDKRSQAVAAMLSNYLSPEQYTDYNHFISMKCKLLVDSREVADKIQLGEEQLSALQETLGNDSSPIR